MEFTFAHNNFNVLHLEKSLAFYKEALQLTEVRRYEPPDASFILVFLGDVNGQKCLLVTCGDNNGALNYHLRGRGGSWSWAEFEPEMQAAMEELLAAKEEIIGDEPANRWIDRPKREPWVLQVTGLLLVQEVQPVLQARKVRSLLQVQGPVVTVSHSRPYIRPRNTERQIRKRGCCRTCNIFLTRAGSSGLPYRYAFPLQGMGCRNPRR